MFALGTVRLWGLRVCIQGAQPIQRSSSLGKEQSSSSVLYTVRDVLWVNVPLGMSTVLMLSMRSEASAELTWVSVPL